MAYAVFTHRAGPFDAEALREAFAATPKLTAIDAKRAERMNTRTRVGIPGGVIMVGLETEVAETLARELSDRDIRAEAVDESWLALPLLQPCKRADTTHDGLVLHLYDGPLSVRWPDVACISAGVVTVARNTAASDAMTMPGMRFPHTTQVTAPHAIQPERSYLEKDELILDVVVEEPLRRFRFKSDQFVVQAPGRGERDSPYRDREARGEVLALSELVHHAEEAAQSTGAERLLRDGEPHVYKSLTDFAHEIAWLLWRHRGPAVNRRATPFKMNDEEAAARSEVAQRALAHKTAGLDHLMATTQRADATISAAGGTSTALLLGLSILESFSVGGVLGVIGVGAAGGVVLYRTLRQWRARRFWET